MNALLEEEKLELIRLQDELDNLYFQKAKGAFTRSRSKWLEEDQNSHYFFNLEKYYSLTYNISSININ